MRSIDNCPECGVTPHTPHLDGCDVELCNDCHEQRMLCDCPGYNPQLSAWTGYWPGVIECNKLGWFAKMIKGAGWVACDKDDPDATEDLNRWYAMYVTGVDPGPVVYI